MGEALTTWSPPCNGSVNVQLSGDATTSDAGTLLLREALDRSGVIEAMEDHLVDPGDPLRIRHSLASQPSCEPSCYSVPWAGTTSTTPAPSSRAQCGSWRAAVLAG